MTRFVRDAQWAALSDRQRVLIAMAGAIAEHRFTGEALHVSTAKIFDAIHGRRDTTGDLASISRALAREHINDELIEWLIRRRIAAVQAIFDEPGVWNAVARVADALVDQGELSGPEVEALVGDADQQPLRSPYSDFAVPPG
jgi:hypothetical protein